MSDDGDPRSNEEIVADALAEMYEETPERMAIKVVAALSVAGRHIISEGECVIGGGRWMLETVGNVHRNERVPSRRWEFHDKNTLHMNDATAYIVVGGTDRP